MLTSLAAEIQVFVTRITSKLKTFYIETCFYTPVRSRLEIGTSLEDPILVMNLLAIVLKEMDAFDVFVEIFSQSQFALETVWR